MSMLAHVFFSWLLSVKLGFGVMVSTVLAYVIPNVGQLMYITCGGCRETWNNQALCIIWRDDLIGLKTYILLC
ncbi:hypothetical protein SASPL_128632 [Salvia splendens]|uniref:Uncharacterized protein n=1 Tax=Salvia splendens TaxID=180675 RepID=A0A8X8XE59_SALSN|nr:hypothetical protein SASPL_128632 [Salvia splendens]